MKTHDEVIDILSRTGWADVDQPNIPPAVFRAARLGRPIPPRPMRKKAEPKPQQQSVQEMRAAVPHLPFRKTLNVWRNGVRGRARQAEAGRIGE